MKLLNHFFANLLFSCYLLIPSLLFAQNISGTSSAQVSFHAEVEALSRTSKNKMYKKTWYKHCPVSLDDLVSIKLSFWDFGHQPQEGELIVNRNVKDEVIQIFKTLFDAKFPIEQMRPLYEFNGDDHKAMLANNTSGFNCRRMTHDSRYFSIHSYGLAIDINPVQNPFIKRRRVLPAEGKAYLNRETQQPGMVVKDQLVYNAFKQHGWSWGGDWKSMKDYQHFEKLP